MTCFCGQLARLCPQVPHVDLPTKFLDSQPFNSLGHSFDLAIPFASSIAVAHSFVFCSPFLSRYKDYPRSSAQGRRSHLSRLLETRRVVLQPTRQEVLYKGWQSLIVPPNRRDVGPECRWELLRTVATDHSTNHPAFPLLCTVTSHSRIRSLMVSPSQFARSAVRRPDSKHVSMPSWQSWLVRPLFRLPGCQSVLPFNVHQDIDGTSLVAQRDDAKSVRARSAASALWVLRCAGSASMLAACSIAFRRLRPNTDLKRNQKAKHHGAQSCS